jgi:hypothetical protein
MNKVSNQYEKQFTEPSYVRNKKTLIIPGQLISGQKSPKNLEETESVIEMQAI